MLALSGLKIAYFVYVWPEPESSAAGVRVAQNLAILADAGAEILLLSAAKNKPQQQEYPNTSWESILLNSSSLEVRLRSFAPNIVLYDRFVTEEQFGSRVERAAPEALRILDTQDLHCLRTGRDRARQCQSEIIRGESALDPAILPRELAAILRSDLTLLLSDFEFECLTNHFEVDARLLHWLPFCYKESDLTTLSAPFQERQGFCFLGNYQHAPNLDGVLYLLREIWPAIANRLPGAQLKIGGAYITQQVQEAAKKAVRVQVEPSVHSAFDFFATARVNLAPLRFGAGIKGKISEGWRAGTPCIGTPIAAEGMGAAFLWDGCIAENTSTFVERAVRIHEEDSAWTKASENGKEILRTYFRKEILEGTWLERIQILRQNLSAHRQQNHVGSILRLEQYRATDFFSRWLELKQQLTNQKI